jgi:23S rRNA pseudouridine1911/1915/1917 synthase
MQQVIQRQAHVTSAEHGKRFDQAASLLFAEFSREKIKQWILLGQCQLNGQVEKPKFLVNTDDVITINSVLTDTHTWQADAINPLPPIIYEDEALIVINKPAGLVVHPGNGNTLGTLVNALLAYEPQLALLPRAGIVHRLDKDTSGLLVVARSAVAYTHLVKQLQQKTVQRYYEALVYGRLHAGGCINQPLGRHPQHRTKRAVLHSGGKPAVTHYRVLRAFAHYTHVGLDLETGRTHQIRVHLQFLRHHVLGDRVYGGALFAKGNPAVLNTALQQLQRQALHAKRLALVHPLTGELCQWEIPLASDIQALLEVLRLEDQHAYFH